LNDIATNIGAPQDRAVPKIEFEILDCFLAGSLGLVAMQLSIQN